MVSTVAPGREVDEALAIITAAAEEADSQERSGSGSRRLGAYSGSASWVSPFGRLQYLVTLAPVPVSHSLHCLTDLRGPR